MKSKMMRRAAMFAASTAILVSAFSAVTVTTASAWEVPVPSVSVNCVQGTDSAKLEVSVFNDEPADNPSVVIDMSATLGGQPMTPALVTVPGQQSGKFSVELKNGYAGGSGTITMTWHDGHPGTDTRQVAVPPVKDCTPPPVAPVIDWYNPGPDCNSNTYPMTVTASAENDGPTQAQVKITNGATYDYVVPAGGQQTQDISINPGETQEVALILVSDTFNPDHMAQAVFTTTAPTQEVCHPTPVTTPPKNPAPPKTSPPAAPPAQPMNPCTPEVQANGGIDAAGKQVCTAYTGSDTWKIALVGGLVVLIGFACVIVGPNSDRRRRKLVGFVNRKIEQIKEEFDNPEFHAKATAS